MRYALTIAALIAGLRPTSALAQKLTLDEAVRRSLDRSIEREQARLAVVIANERYLEAQSKFRLELRPRIGLLAFSNPALLASSIGLGMLAGRTPPPLWVRHSARLDSLATEVAIERAVVMTRFETMRQYFQVLLRQQERDELASLIKYFQTTRGTLGESANSTRGAALTRAVWETRLITIETQLEEAESSLQEAASTLAQTVGVNYSGYVLQVADIDGAERDEEIPSTPMLQNVAMKQGYSESPVWRKLEAEKKRIGGKPGFAVAPLSAGYAHVSDHAGSKLGVGPNGFLLGGHTGTIDLGVKLSLWRTGESEALASLVAARIRSIELELLSVGDSVQRELEDLRQLVVSSRRKVELAARRLKLSTEVSRLVALREKAGLESTESLLSAEADLMRSRAQFQQAQLESRTRWLHLLAACGRGDADGARKVLVGQANTSAHEVGADQ